MGTLVFLVGPKAAGKSWCAHLMESARGVHYVDADLLIPELVARGVRPHPEDGWLAPVEDEVRRALEGFDVVSVEATGAWASDFKLATDLEAAGHTVLRVRVTAPEEETLVRLKTRTLPLARTSEADARWIYREALANAAGRDWDLVYDTAGPPAPERFIAAIGPLLDAASRTRSPS